MKKLYSLILVLGILNSYAQTLDDIEVFNIKDLHGTPRFTAMGGAFTSLGNDLSAIHINPASVAVYRNSNVGFTFGFQSNNSDQSSFFGGNASSSDFNFSIENMGFASTFSSGPYKKESKFGFAFSLQKIADYNRTYSINGINNLGAFGAGSLADYWLNGDGFNNSAAGLMGSELQSFGLNEAFAAFQTGILVPVNDTLISDVGFGNSTTGTSDLRYFKDESGYHNELAITLGAQSSEKLYVGFSIGIPFLSYRMEDQIRESNLPIDSFPFDATSYQLNRVNEMHAAGINLKAGFIFKPVQWWRLGASYQSPSWYSVNQVYEFDVSSQFSDGSQFNSVVLSTGEYEYGIRTPSIMRVGTSLVLGKLAILSVDYEHSDPSQGKTYETSSFNALDEQDLTDGNTDVSNLMTSTNSLRIGGEIKLGLLFLRGGFVNQSSFYQSGDDYRADQQTISAGLGYQTKKYNLDLTFSSAKYSRQDWVHPFASGDLVNTQNTRNNILVGATFRL